ncbi:MAG: FG-GAP-like repeat-containing protein [Phycisphaerales bacterium]
MPTIRLAFRPVAAVLAPALGLSTIVPTVALAQPCDPTQLFAPPAAIDVGELPLDVETGDLDGDGDLDLVVANTANDDISVLLNDGTGALALEVRYAAGSEPVAVAIADLNGDGDTDLVVANGTGDDVSVLLNNGDATFAPGVTYGLTDRPTSIVLGDLDGDGDTDLAAAVDSIGTGIVGVLLNNGDATFAPEVSYAVGQLPESIALGDLDGDGDDDLAVVNLIDDTVTVLVNGGDATFPTSTLLNVGDQPNAVALGDMDGDGDHDLVVANFSDDDVSVLLNNGDATFAPGVRYAVGRLPVAVALGDLDGDGDHDLVVAKTGSLGGANDLSVLLNDGAGAFGPEVRYTAGDSPSSLALGDLDGDGDHDLAVANASGDDLSVLRNRCVALPPRIVTQPGPFVLLPPGGGVAELRVVAAGTGPLAYRWFRNRQPLADGGGVSGASTPILTVDATVEDTATYGVRVTNALGSVFSDEALIAVEVPCSADFDGDGTLTLFDFLGFSNAFDAGCP